MSYTKLLVTCLMCLKISKLNFSRKAWLVISTLSGIITLSIITYCLLKYPDFKIYGEQFIVDEWAPFMFVQFKPMTLMFFFTFIWWGSLLQFLRPNLLKLNKNWLSLTILISFLVLFASLYELFFNFALWSALMSITNVTNPDILYNRFPNPDTPVSLVYATKIIILLLSVSAYTIYFLYDLVKRKG